MKKRNNNDENQNLKWVEKTPELDHIQRIESITKEFIYTFLTVFMGSFGIMLLVTTSMKINLNDTAAFSVLIMLMSLLPTILYKKKGGKFKVYLGMVAVFAVFTLINLKPIIVSTIITVNRFIEQIAASLKLDGKQLAVPEFGVTGSGMGYFLVVFAFVICMIVGYTVCVRHSVFLSMIIPVSLIIFMVIFDFMPSGFSLIMVFAYFAGVMSLSKAPESFNVKSIPIIICGILSVCFVFMLLTFSEPLFMKSHTFERMNESLRAFLMDAGFDGNMKMDGDINGGLANGGVNGGELGLYDSVKYRHESMLKLTMASSGTGQYLKGFAGSVYADNRWSEPGDDAYIDYTGFFSAKNGVKLYNELQPYYFLMGITAFDSTKKTIKDAGYDLDTGILRADFTVMYTGADKNYWYIPYASNIGMSTNITKSSYDGNISKDNNGYIQGSYYTVKDMNYDIIRNSIDGKLTINVISSYKNWESGYRKFAYDVYTRVPEGLSDNIRRFVTESVPVSSDERNAYIKQVTDYFDSEFTYTLSPGRLPEGKDFINYFMDESKKGYCTYFATAATMMFRAAGIPARYVEGYYLPDSEIVSGTVGKGLIKSPITNTVNSNNYEYYDNYTFSAYDNNAHAWVEIYEDGYGWVPVEVTPGMVSETSVEADNLNNFSGAPQDNGSMDPEDPAQKETDPAVGNDKGDDKSGIGGMGNTGIGFSFSDFMKIFESMSWYSRIGLIVIFAFFAILSIWYVILRRSRNRLNDILLMKSGLEEKPQVIAVYEFINRIAGFMNLSKPFAMEHEEYAEYLKEVSECFAECKINDIMEIVLKARFSNTDIKNEEAVFVSKQALKLRKCVYSELGYINKLKFRYIYRLY